jgi:phenylacetate-coenzyme A ligase PaaK-like adenylate-forming protein
MSFTGRLLLNVHQSLKGSRSLAMLREMAPVPTRSREEILAYQFSRLSSLLAEAEAHVPYYRELFRNLGIRSRDIRSLSDFSSLPILTKDIIRAQPDALLKEGLKKEELRVSHSGGSTGSPVSFYHDADYDDFAEAGTFRNLLQCGWKPGETIAYVWGGNDRLYALSGWQLEARQYLRRRYQFDPFHSGAKEMDGWLKQWRRIKPSVIFGYASTVARFAAHIRSKGETARPLKGVFTTAERLYLPQRETIAGVFGCPVYDCYGSSEVRNIAAECPQGRMHVNADCVVLEVERAGVPAGEPVPFLVTSLKNQIMPFIRYRSEDCGRLADASCGCGSNFPLMDLSIARVSDSFVLPGGRVVHGEFFTHLMYGSEGISSFQFHQTAFDSIVLWIVPGPGDPNARNRCIRETVEKVKKLDPSSAIKVEVRTTEAIPLSRMGKHRFIRSDVHALVEANT